VQPNARHHGASSGVADHPAPAPPAGPRRRPSGELPPLPRQVGRGTRAFAALGAVVVVLWVGLLVGRTARAITAADLAVLELLARARTGPATTVAETLQAAGSEWTVRIVAWTTLVLLVAFRRFQHLLAYLVLVLLVTAVNATVAVEIGRMRPADVVVLGDWTGYSHPSAPLAALAFAAVGAVQTLVPAGRWRARTAVVAGATVGSVALARLYLAVDHPTDALAGLVMGAALPLVAFRLLTPDDVFPVTYRGGRRAHLDVGGRRGEAIRTALRSQLGLEVDRIEPFRLSGSAGSMPLRLHVVGDPIEHRFGKLYALGHLRSDRWYKLARTVRYGRLEDELPFNAVRRLVAYEDHMLRLMRDAGVPTATPHGFVEITPEREYLLVTELLEGCRELDAVRVDEQVIDAALGIVRTLWDAGLAHRDIKPSNLLVRGDEVFVIDVAFGEARPTPWRQAVDLANMMLTLGLCSTPELVYERALLRFSPDEVAEAFAATRSVTMPNQLRLRLRADGRDLLGAFRSLAPERDPISIQRWSLRRIGLTLSVAGAAVATTALVAANLRLAGLL
jgi:tRNA A-37 threonylcarbamoyl transferase component Bud32/membrane-associated phospholipid phosphatase